MQMTRYVYIEVGEVRIFIFNIQINIKNSFSFGF